MACTKNRKEILQDLREKIAKGEPIMEQVPTEITITERIQEFKKLHFAS